MDDLLNTKMADVRYDELHMLYMAQIRCVDREMISDLKLLINIIIAKA